MTSRWKKLIHALALALTLALALVGTANQAQGEDRLGQEIVARADPQDDAALRSRLETAFAKIEQFQGLKVEISGGVVVLSGRTPLFNSAQEAVKLAAHLPGVLYVVDRIEVETKVDSYLAPAWRKLRHVLDQVLNFAPLLGIAGLVLLVFYLAGRLISGWDWPYRRLGKRVLLRGLIRQMVRYIFLFTGLLATLEILGLTALLGAFMGAAGLLGLALGFAFKDIVENYVAGFLLSIRSPFAYMDWIKVDGHSGSVVRVTSRELVIMNLEGNHVRIPNAQVFKSVIYNYTRNPLRRFDIDLGIGTGEDLTRVAGIGTAVLEAMKGVAEDPAPTMRNLEFGDSAMLVRFSGWVDQTAADFIKVRSEAVRILKEALDAAGVDLPVPIQQVINVQPEAPEPETPGAGDELLEEAKRAEVGRESFLDEQIERDRQKSRDVDLLSEEQGR